METGAYSTGIPPQAGVETGGETACYTADRKCALVSGVIVVREMNRSYLILSSPDMLTCEMILVASVSGTNVLNRKVPPAFGHQ